MKKLALILICCASCGAGATQAVSLVANGRSTYSICLSQAASPSERRGAEEFQRFIEEMSGARLPIVTEDKAHGNLVVIGESRFTRKLNLGRLGPEEFVLRTSGRSVIIAGGRQRGTMYGVYTLLEKLGCRWFSPDLSRIPRISSISVPALSEISVTKTQDD